MRAIILSLLAMVVLACESEIDVDLNESIPTLSVDAFINNMNQEQRIILYFSQPYFENNIYEPAAGASVVVTDITQGIDFTFEEKQDDFYPSQPAGRYISYLYPYHLVSDPLDQKFVYLTDKNYVRKIDIHSRYVTIVYNHPIKEDKIYIQWKGGGFLKSTDIIPAPLDGLLKQFCLHNI